MNRFNGNGSWREARMNLEEALNYRRAVRVFDKNKLALDPER